MIIWFTQTFQCRLWKVEWLRSGEGRSTISRTSGACRTFCETGNSIRFLTSYMLINFLYCHKNDTRMHICTHQSYQTVWRPRACRSALTTSFYLSDDVHLCILAHIYLFIHYKYNQHNLKTHTHFNLAICTKRRDSYSGHFHESLLTCLPAIAIAYYNAHTDSSVELLSQNSSRTYL